VATLTELEILRFLIEVGALLVASRVLGDLMKRVGEAPVIGELFAGVLLGRGVLGFIAPPVYALLFPADPVVGRLLEALAWIGVIMLLLQIGLETDLRILRGMGRTTLLVSACGMVIPFGCGLALGYYLPAHYLAAPDQRLIFTLFIAVAVAVSAVPVIAKMLIDLGLLHRDLGMLILAAGIVDDTTGWLLLSLVAGLAERGTVNAAAFAILLASAGAFIAFCYFIGWRAVGRLARWIDERAFVEHWKVSFMVAVALGCAIATQAIGIHAVFGAFIAGLMLREAARLRKSDRTELEGATLGFLAPIFFAYSGLRADLSSLRDPIVPLLVLAVACAAKLAGCTLGGLLGRLGVRESIAVAVGMNARGGMGILVALVGLSLGVLTPQMYTIIIMVAVVTSLMTPPLLTWAIDRVAERPSESERRERQRLLARIQFTREGAKLLVLTGGGPHGELAAHLAAALGNHHDASITLLRAVAPGQQVRGDAIDAQFAQLRAIAELAGARNISQRTVTGEPIAETIAAESARGYDAIFAGASQLTGRDDLGGDVLRGLVSAAAVPVIIVRGGAAKVPFRRLLAPITGAAFSRLGATIAMQYARAFESQVVAIYVRESLPLFGVARTPADEGGEFVAEIRRLGQELGVRVDARVGRGRRPQDVIVQTVTSENIDLLVMGVLLRSSDQRLFFGPKVRDILAAAPCPVAVVVTPPQQFIY
jgi:K+:H+ antiporter